MLIISNYKSSYCNFTTLKTHSQVVYTDTVEIMTSLRNKKKFKEEEDYEKKHEKIVTIDASFSTKHCNVDSMRG